MSSNSPQPTHTIAPTLPTQAKVGDWLFLDGNNAHVKSLLCQLRFESTDGQTGFGKAFQRDDCDKIFFQVSASMVGTMKVTGNYHADSTEPNHDFGTIVITA